MRLLSFLIAFGLIFGMEASYAQSKRNPSNKSKKTKVIEESEEDSSMSEDGSAEAEEKPVKKAKYKYGLAGCGLGSIVFGAQPGFIQVVAATLNGTSGTQTFGITSGTSNCGASNRGSRAEQFIEYNKVAIENDLARGAGESVATLQEVMGCTNNDFTIELKSKYNVGGSKSDLTQAAVQSCEIM